jgi:hypothetical protein
LTLPEFVGDVEVLVVVVDDLEPLLPPPVVAPPEFWPKAGTSRIAAAAAVIPRIRH